MVDKIELTIEQIENCTDKQQLKQWLEDMAGLRDAIKGRAESIIEYGFTAVTYDDRAGGGAKKIVTNTEKEDAIEALEGVLPSENGYEWDSGCNQRSLREFSSIVPSHGKIHKQPLRHADKVYMKQLRML